MENKKLCFIQYVGKNINDKNIYEFLFTDNIESVWGSDWEIFPAGLCNELPPKEDSYSEVHTIETDIEFGLVQNSLCFSMQDCIDGIVALAYEDISGYEDYPEEGRLVFHFGDDYEEVEEILAEHNILMTEKEKSEES